MFEMRLAITLRLDFAQYYTQNSRMSNATHPAFVQDAWQTPRNARTLRAFMALQQSEIAERIKKLREAKGNPPQEVVAQQLGVSHRAYQAWESGEARPAYRNLTKLATYYGVTEEHILIGDTGDGPAEPQLGQLDRIEARLEEILSLLVGGGPAEVLEAEAGRLAAQREQNDAKPKRKTPRRKAS